MLLKSGCSQSPSLRPQVMNSMVSPPWDSIRWFRYSSPWRLSCQYSVSVDRPGTWDWSCRMTKSCCCCRLAFHECPGVSALSACSLSFSPPLVSDVTTASSPESVRMLSSLTASELVEVYELPSMRMSKELSLASVPRSPPSIPNSAGEFRCRIMTKVMASAREPRPMPRCQFRHAMIPTPS